MRTIIISLLTFGIAVALIVKLALPSLNSNGKAVKDRTELYYNKIFQN